jgi:Mg-chelatase subunit ChlI
MLPVREQESRVLNPFLFLLFFWGNEEGDIVEQFLDRFAYC